MSTSEDAGKSQKPPHEHGAECHLHEDEPAPVAFSCFQCCFFRNKCMCRSFVEKENAETCRSGGVDAVRTRARRKTDFVYGNNAVNKAGFHHRQDV